MRKNILLAIVCFSLTLSLLSFPLAFGEKPIKEGNIAKNTSFKTTPSSADAAKLQDNKLNSSTKVQKVFIDLRKLCYLKELQVFQKKAPTGLKISEDIINWSPLIKPSSFSNGVAVFDLSNYDARYISLINEEEIDCKEIAIYLLADYKLYFEHISANPSKTDCTIKVNTNYSVLSQAVYGYNYDFIYAKKLDFAVSSLTPGKEHTIKIERLKPETTYRYQIKVTDFNSNMLYSNYFTFTTLPQDGQEEK